MAIKKKSWWMDVKKKNHLRFVTKETIGMGITSLPTFFMMAIQIAFSSPCIKLFTYNLFIKYLF